MTMRPNRRLPILFLFAVVFVTVAPLHAESPWELLEELRQSMESAGPITGTFDQTYVPAGFSTGDLESGHLSLWLPRCVRWNYVEPQAKHFLYCDREVYYWNDLEPGGRHYVIEPEAEPGLDLLLVDVTRLRERYLAESERLADGTYNIRLETPAGAEPAFAATLHIDPVADRVLDLEYTDAEGNRTRFDIGGYQKLEHTALFQPPKDIEWTSD
ncbi:MAG: outer membrane lipoprotein carrier protein LolA [Acidobacteriota bacterium]